MLLQIKRLLVTAALIFTTLVFIARPHALLAEDSPQNVVQEMLQRLKTEKDPAVMLEYVHWQSAWESFPQNERREMGVHSAGEFRQYFEGFFRDPKRFVHERMLNKQAQQLPDEQLKQQEASIAHIAQMLEQKRNDMRLKMSKTTYTIGEVSQQGDAATVEIISSLDGKTKKQKLPLQRIGGKWYLPTMKFIQDSEEKRFIR